MVQTILPKVDLTYDDIRDTLNANGGSVTNDVQTAFSEKANINRWAKYKPVKYTGDFPLEGDYWRAEDGNCGLTIEQDDILNGYRNGTAWKYEPPTGTLRFPFRLLDFRGYATFAEAPVKTHINKADNPESMNIEERYYIFVAVQVIQSSDNSLVLTDFALPIDVPDMRLAWKIYDYDVMNSLLDAPIAHGESTLPITGNQEPIKIDVKKPSYIGKTLYIVFYLKGVEPDSPKINLPYSDEDYFMKVVRITSSPIVDAEAVDLALWNQDYPDYYPVGNLIPESNALDVGANPEGQLVVKLDVRNRSEIGTVIKLSNDGYATSYVFRFVVTDTYADYPQTIYGSQCIFVSENMVTPFKDILLKPGESKPVYIVGPGEFYKFQKPDVQYVLLEYEVQCKSPNGAWQTVSAFRMFVQYY